MGSVSVSSCRCCMFVPCVHPVVVLNAAFCMTCSLLMLVNSCYHFYERVLLSCDTQIVCVYEATYSVVERLVVIVDVEKDGGQDTSMWQAVLLFPPSDTLIVKFPHRTPYWTACSGLRYIVGCLELCCRVSVLGFYDSLCRKRQIG